MTASAHRPARGERVIAILARLCGRIQNVQICAPRAANIPRPQAGPNGGGRRRDLGAPPSEPHPGPSTSRPGSHRSPAAPAAYSTRPAPAGGPSPRAPHASATTRKHCTTRNETDPARPRSSRTRLRLRPGLAASRSPGRAAPAGHRRRRPARDDRPGRRRPSRTSSAQPGPGGLNVHDAPIAATCQGRSCSPAPGGLRAGGERASLTAGRAGPAGTARAAAVSTRRRVPMGRCPTGRMPAGMPRSAR